MEPRTDEEMNEMGQGDSMKTAKVEVGEVITPAEECPIDTSEPNAKKPKDKNSVVPHFKYGWREALCVFVSLVTYIFDQVTDIILAVYFFKHGHYWYFGLTLAFVIIPSVTMTIFSLTWYVQDYDNEQRPPASRFQWFLRVLFLIFNFGPILRYFESCYYGCKSKVCKEKKKPHFLYLMIYEDTDAGLLRLFECFMEAAPQLVLQIYILSKNNIPESIDTPFKIGLQVLSISSSLISLSWAIASYNRSLRFSLDNKMKMTWMGTIFQFFWRLFLISSRVLSLALFASVYPYYVAIVCGAHWVIMTIWILFQKTEFCEKRWQEVFFDIVIGVIYIFCYFNVKDMPTRRKYSFYYILSLLEGSTLMTIWFLTSDPTSWYRLPAYICYYLAFAVGISLMLIYYRFFHPSLRFQRHRAVMVAAEDAPDGPLEYKQATILRQPSKKLGRLTDVNLNAL